jgi:Flp pilus assembly protein TadD
MPVRLALVLLTIGSIGLGGCAARRDSLTRRFVRPADASSEAREPAAARGESLAQFMRRVRHLTANARPRPKSILLPTIETQDYDLARALAAASSTPTSAHLRRVAYAYYRLGVRDTAHEYFNRALKADPHDALAYDGMARLWRDWGLPSLGLPDAHRAAFFAPGSPVAQNTLGTLYQALGRTAEAREAYTQAVALNPTAAYALSNLCYLSVLEARAAEAVRECEAALRVDPSLVTARNNLALAHAASGRVELAEAQILAASDRATGLYNVGILRMSLHEYGTAAVAFKAASDARPRWRAPRARARQVARLLEGAARPDGGR